MQKSESANLDLLRSVAVGCVFFSHLLFFSYGIEYVGPFSVNTLGRAGVIIFFVHTTLVLLMSLDRSKETGAALFIDFYVRRAFRIYPLAVVTVLFIVATTTWPGWLTVRDNLLLITDLTKRPEVLNVLWSLPFEVQMYVVIPLIYLLVRKRGQWVRWLTWSLSVAVVLGVWAAHFRNLTDLLCFSPCFLAGTVALGRKSKNPNPGWQWPIRILLILSAFCLVSFESAWLTLWAWPICVALGSSVPNFCEISWAPVKWITKRIARYSYGIYLCHSPILTFCFQMHRSWPGIVQWLTCAVLMLSVPLILFHAIEDPMIVAGKRIANRTTRGLVRRQPVQATAQGVTV